MKGVYDMYEEELMTTKEVEENEEVMVEDAEAKKSHKGLLVLSLVGGVLIAGGTLAYKKLIKPMIDKKKAQEEIDKNPQIILEEDYEECDDSEDE